MTKTGKNHCWYDITFFLSDLRQIREKNKIKNLVKTKKSVRL